MSEAVHSCAAILVPVCIPGGPGSRRLLTAALCHPALDLLLWTRSLLRFSLVCNEPMFRSLVLITKKSPAAPCSHPCPLRSWIWFLFTPGRFELPTLVLWDFCSRVSDEHEGFNYSVLCYEVVFLAKVMGTRKSPTADNCVVLSSPCLCF